MLICCSRKQLLSLAILKKVGLLNIFGVKIGVSQIKKDNPIIHQGLIKLKKSEVKTFKMLKFLFQINAVFSLNVITISTKLSSSKNCYQH